MKVAIVHEWFANRAGSERVVEEMLACFPGASLFSLVDFVPDSERGWLAGKRATTSFIQRLPFARRHFRAYLPLMPMAIEALDVSAFDVVISSSHAVAKGVITRPGQVHVCYIHSPMRYAWDQQRYYLPGGWSLLARPIVNYLRAWDVRSAGGVHCFIANSAHIAERVRRTYGRAAGVIHPPVAIERFDHRRPREEFFCTVSRLVPYKRVDILVRAFTKLALPLVVIGGGPCQRSLRRIAGSTITFLGQQNDGVVADYLGRCRAFVYAAEEDFGIVLAEAQAAGAPVIAYGRGGSRDIVSDGVTGMLFSEQSADALVSVVLDFMSQSKRFCAERISASAERFSKKRFREQLSAAVMTEVAARRADCN